MFRRFYNSVFGMTREGCPQHGQQYDETLWLRLLRVMGRYCWGNLKVYSQNLTLPPCLVRVHYGLAPQTYAMSTGINTSVYQAPLPLNLPVQAVSHIHSLSTVSMNLYQELQVEDSIHITSMEFKKSLKPTLKKLPPIENLETHIHQTNFTDLEGKANTYQWSAPKVPRVSVLSESTYKKHQKPVIRPLKLEDLKFEGSFKSKLNTLKPIPVLREPIPAHRFSTGQRDVFRKKLAEQCSEEGGILLRYVYDRIPQGAFQQLLPQGDGYLKCVFNQQQSLNKLSSLSTEEGYVVVGQHMSTRQTVTAFVAASLVQT